MSNCQLDAMYHVFELQKVMDEGNLSLGELVEVVKMAVASGHEELIICLQMVSHAVQMALDDKESQ